MYEKILDEIEKKLLEDTINGYKVMAELNSEMSEYGIEEDYKDFLRYEESIMGCGIWWE